VADELYVLCCLPNYPPFYIRAPIQQDVMRCSVNENRDNDARLIQFASIVINVKYGVKRLGYCMRTYKPVQRISQRPQAIPPPRGGDRIPVPLPPARLHNTINPLRGQKTRDSEDHQAGRNYRHCISTQIAPTGKEGETHSTKTNTNYPTPAPAP
jgi:hypothetical protein